MEPVTSEFESARRWRTEDLGLDAPLPCILCSHLQLGKMHVKGYRSGMVVSHPLWIGTEKPWCFIPRLGFSWSLTDLVVQQLLKFSGIWALNFLSLF